MQVKSTEPLNLTQRLGFSRLLGHWVILGYSRLFSIIESLNIDTRSQQEETS